MKLSILLGLAAVFLGRYNKRSVEEVENAEEVEVAARQLADWKRYSDQRTELDAISLELGARYDKLALAVSGGAFVLSLTFLEKVTSSAPHWAGWILIIGWFLLMIAIGAHLFALRCSSRIQQIKIEDLDADYISERDDVPRIDTLKNEIGRFTKYLRFSNETGMWTAIFGILMIVIFSAIAFRCDPKQNTDNPKNNSDERKVKTESRQKSKAYERIDKGGGILRSQSAHTTSRQSEQGEEKMSEKKPSKSKHGSKGSYVPPANAQKPPAPQNPKNSPKNDK